MSREKPLQTTWTRICSALAVPVTSSLDAVHARLPDVGRGTLQRIRNGVPGTRLDSLKKIAATLHISVGELVDTEDSHSSTVTEPHAAWMPTPPVSLENAIHALLDAIAALPPARWASVKAQLEQAATNPAMRPEVVGELLLLLTRQHRDTATADE